MELSVEAFKEDFKTQNIEYIVSKWIMEKIPFIFDGNYEMYLHTKIILSKLLKVDSCDIIFVGSASTGFSLNPKKNFRAFNEKSDIDIAIISNYYFNMAWRTIRNTDITKQMPDVYQSLEDHRKRLIFWGTIATDKILGLMPFAKEWLFAINELKKIPVFENKDINFRLYQNHESLRRYHAYNLIKISAGFFDVEPQSINL